MMLFQLFIYRSARIIFSGSGNDFIRRFKKHPDICGKSVVHCFTGDKATLEQYLAMGFYLGIGGVSTFQNARQIKEVIAYAPLDRLVLETDCPYMAPGYFFKSA